MQPNSHAAVIARDRRNSKDLFAQSPQKVDFFPRAWNVPPYQRILPGQALLPTPQFGAVWSSAC
jgi:hypothetical protein